MELTPDARGRIQLAVKSAEADVVALRFVREGGSLKAVERLLAAWDDVHPEAKQWIKEHLGESGVSERSLPDVGTAARAWLSQYRGRQGTRIDSWPLKVAVQQLFVEWVDAGGIPEVGNRGHRREVEKRDHPACEFVAKYLLEMFPEQVPDRPTALRRADTYLRDLARHDQLPTRKKRSK